MFTRQHGKLLCCPTSRSLPWFVEKSSLLPQSAQYNSPENSSCRSACFLGRRLFAQSSCSHSNTLRSTLAKQHATACMNLELFVLFSVRRLTLGYHLHFPLWLEVINDGLMFLWWCFIRLSFFVVGKIKYKIGKPFLE